MSPQVESAQTHSATSLIKATLIAIGIAVVLLVTLVLPAEYGIDPTGVGRQLGLDSLHATSANGAASSAKNDELAAQAAAAFGKNSKQSFIAEARAQSSTMTLSTHTQTVTLEAGKGTELKSHLQAGDGVVYHWKASGEVALDMHGEQPETKGWTTYAASTGMKEDAGTFIAPFTGTHGWYWKNRSDVPVTVEITLYGFQPDLYRP